MSSRGRDGFASAPLARSTLLTGEKKGGSAIAEGVRYYLPQVSWFFRTVGGEVLRENWFSRLGRHGPGHCSPPDRRRPQCGRLESHQSKSGALAPNGHGLGGHAPRSSAPIRSHLLHGHGL